MKLFFIKCKGMTTNLGNNTAHGCAYVVAEDPTRAYTILREYLDKNNLGFMHERELDSISLIAEMAQYPKCGTQLFIDEAKIVFG